MDRVNKNRVSKYENTQYKPGDSVDFFKNTVNPQRTCGVIVEQVMAKKYRVRYGDNQHTKMTTNNMVPVNTPNPEANPEDINITIEDIEEDAGLTQQPMMVNFTPPPKEVPGTDHRDTDPSPWSDEDKVSNPEYPLSNQTTQGKTLGAAHKQKVPLQTNWTYPSHNDMMIRR